MLLVCGPGVTPGYLSAAHERGAHTADGWIISGDLGRVDEDGYIFVTGRAKDVIIRGGHNIDPALIEEPLSQSPDVLLAAAVGKPDAYAGELPVAYVQLAEDSRATPAQLAHFLQGRIGERAAFPKDIFIVDKLPLTAVGKPLKNELRRDAAERVFRAVVAEAIRGTAGEGQATVGVQPDATSGTLATITLTCPDSQRAALEARIKTALAPFAMAHRIV
jgi:fatty-acyl-CoA synthase